MSKVRKTFLLFAVSASLCLVTVSLCYFVAEKYFFDKFFYQKSISHGYFPMDRQVPFSVFGDRSKYLSLLDGNSQVLGAQTDKKFTILLIGDSYVWGIGIKNNQRFATILEQQLNSHYPTQVIAVANPGWNSTEFLNAYQKVTAQITPDLTIFSLVHNDSFLFKDNSKTDTFKICQSKFPNTQAYFDVNLAHLQKKDITLEEIDEAYSNSFENGWSNPVNLCVLEKNLQALPNERTIYFITDSYYDPKLFARYIPLLQTYNKTIIYSEKAKEMDKYRYLWDGLLYQKLSPSPKEGHPGALANQMFADVLFQEITTNSKWGFTTNDKHP